MSKEKTAMSDLKADLIETKVTAKEALDLIIDKETRKVTNLVVQKTLDNIILRIDTELLELEKQQLIEAHKKGQRLSGLMDVKEIDAEKFYNEKYGNHE